MSPLLLRKPPQPKGESSSAAPSKKQSKDDRNRAHGRRKTYSPPPQPQPHRLARVLRERRHERARSRMATSSTESLPSRPSSPLSHRGGAGAPSDGASGPSSPAADATLITGGTNIWSPASVVVNVSGARSAPPSPPPISPQSLSPTTSYIDEHYENGCDLYRRLMGLKKKGRHALYIPHLNIWLSLERRQQGVSIGDVGIITQNGAFDFMFSIYSPPTGSADLSGLPAGFEQIQTPSSLEREVVVTSEHSAHDALTSSGIAKQVLPNGDITFTCTRPEGAVLVMPDGATNERLLSFTRFQQFFAQHAQAWYAFARETRGSSVSNGDLHLVYGCDKATEWGMAVFNNPHRGTQPAELHFRDLGESWRNRTGTPYAWDHSDDAEARVGPRDREVRELGGSRETPLCNQTLFIQTVNATLREEKWQQLLDSTDIGMDIFDDREQPCISDGVTPESPSSPGPSTSTSPNCPPHGRQHLSSTSFQATVSDAKWHFWSKPQKQPSQVLNDYLLRRYPEARVAATASDIWAHVEDEDVDIPEALIASVLSAYKTTIDADGMASFIESDAYDGTTLDVGELDNRENVDDIMLSRNMLEEPSEPSCSSGQMHSGISRRQVYECSATLVFPFSSCLSMSYIAEDWSEPSHALRGSYDPTTGANGHSHHSIQHLDTYLFGEKRAADFRPTDSPFYQWLSGEDQRPRINNIKRRSGNSCDSSHDDATRKDVMRTATEWITKGPRIRPAKLNHPQPPTNEASSSWNAPAPGAHWPRPMAGGSITTRRQQLQSTESESLRWKGTTELPRGRLCLGSMYAPPKPFRPLFEPGPIYGLPPRRNMAMATTELSSLLNRDAQNEQTAFSKNGHPEFSGVLDSRTPSTKLGSSIWHADLPMNGVFHQARPRDMFAKGGSEDPYSSFCGGTLSPEGYVSTEPSFPGSLDYSTPHNSPLGPDDLTGYAYPTSALGAGINVEGYGWASNPLVALSRRPRTIKYNEGIDRRREKSNKEAVFICKHVNCMPSGPKGQTVDFTSRKALQEHTRRIHEGKVRYMCGSATSCCHKDGTPGPMTSSHRGAVQRHIKIMHPHEKVGIIEQRN